MSVASYDIQARYDRDHDVLYLSVGNPRPAYSLAEDDDGRIIIRHDFETHEIVGVTVVGFRSFDRKKLQARLPFHVDLTKII